MSDVAQTAQWPGASEPGAHDHAWRRIRTQVTDPFRLVGEYRCDLCPATWAM